MVKKKIIITGDRVQEVGYRVYLLTTALNFGASKFYASNVYINKKQAVIVFIEAEKGIINGFSEFIKVNIPDGANVSEINIENFKGKVMGIDQYLHLIQVEQLNKGIPAILDIRDNSKTLLDKQDKMLDKQDKMLDKQDKMLDKQDLHIDIARNGFKEIRNEIHMQRDDFKEVFMKEVSELHNEINEIRATLARMQAA